MKEQYIGDINDFHKYALLRSLAAAIDQPVRVCWMLTAPDGRPDGGRISYLDDRSRRRSLDPELFDALRGIVHDGSRTIEALESSSILPGAHFHQDILTDNYTERGDYFDALRLALKPEELVFFDPDNGLEVPSVKKGLRNSAKYLYWDELSSVLGEGRAVCVYQHFPRRPREPFVAGVLTQLAALAEGHASFAVVSSSVAYLVCAPLPVDDLFQAAIGIASRPDACLGVHSLSSSGGRLDRLA